LVNIHT
jgi:hypothetical protein